MAANTGVFVELERQAILRAVQRPPSNGKYYELWSQYAAHIGQFVKQQNLRQVTIAGEAQVEIAQAAAAGAPTTGATTLSKTATLTDGVNWWSKWGGMKTPHLHYADEIYSMNREQWGAFTKDITQTMTAKLQAAGQVGFDNFMEATDAVGHL